MRFYIDYDELPSIASSAITSSIRVSSTTSTRDAILQETYEVASPAIGWDRAEAVRNKYYFDEVLFYVHVYVANELAKKAMPSQKRTRASSRRCSNIQAYLATNSDDTSTLMTVLSDRLKMYLKPV